MPLSTQSPSGFVSLLQNGITAFTSKVKNFSPGSVAGAIVNSTAAQLLFLQGQAQYLQGVTRAATSSGADLTSFVADYGLTPSRVPATFAQGPVVFSKYQAATVQTVIPIGTIVQNRVTAPATPVQYAVIADATNANYNAALGGYVIAVGATSVSVTAQATSTSPGSLGNLLAGSLSIIVTPGTPADSLSQPNDITNGIDPESDVALRARFQKYVGSLAKASSNAIAAAILAVQPGLTYVLNDNLDQNGNVKTSFFTLVVDDGSGAIPAQTLGVLTSAANAVRAAGISFLTIAPTNIAITIAVTGTVIQPSFNGVTVRQAIVNALIAAVNANGVGGANAANLYTASGKLSFASIAAVVASFIGVGPNQGLSAYGAVTVNGSAADVTLTTYQLARATSATVTVS